MRKEDLLPDMDVIQRSVYSALYNKRAKISKPLAFGTNNTIRVIVKSKTGTEYKLYTYIDGLSYIDTYLDNKSKQ